MPAPTAPEATIARLARLYLTHAQRYYRRPDGTPTGEDANIRCSLAPMLELAGGITPSQLRPAHVKAYIAEGIERDWSRPYIAASLSRVRRMFAWAVEEEACAPGVLHVLASVKAPRAFRTAAREPEPRTPASLEDVARTIAMLSRDTGDVVRLLQLTGARCSELLSLRSVDIDTSDSRCWWAQPSQHKSLHLGRARTIPLGERCIPIIERRLRPFAPEAFLFPSPRNHARPLQRASIAQAIKRACDRGGIPHWTPHQLRHTVATIVRSRAGLDAAQALLGHSRADITERYARLDRARAAEAQEVLP